VKLEAGDPVKEKDKLLDRSPISHVDLLRSPILLTHGENDNRVPVLESRQFAEKAKALGKPVTYVEFEGQGHGLKGIPNQKRLWQARFSFLESALDAPAAGSGGGAPGK
jgi:dipeptidyl aminopeptidase/acylaminoacyl peptidase